MTSTSFHIPTQGTLGQALWQAVRGKLFKGVTPTTVTRPDQVEISATLRTALLSDTCRTVTFTTPATRTVTFGVTP